MASKSFSVRQFDIIGDSGNAVIASSEYIELNTPRVAISTDISVGGKFQSNVVLDAGYSFSGSGQNLTNIPAGQLTGALPAIDGSALTGVVGSGSGVVILDDGSPVGTAGTVDFGANLTVSPISAGVVTVTASGGGGSSQWETTAAGIHTLSNVGIGTTNPTSKLTVAGDVNVSGVVTASSIGINSTSTSALINLYSTGTFIDCNGPAFPGGANKFTVNSDGSCSMSGSLSALNAYLGQGGEVYLYYFADERFRTTSGGINVTGTTDTDNLIVSGISTLNGGLVFGSGSNINFQSSLSFANSNDDAYITLNSLGGVVLYYSDSTRLQTTGTGVTVSGTTFTNQLNVSGVSTFTNGPVLIGSGTSTGTSSQRLQVTGNTYVSGSLGVGATNPSYKFQVSGPAGSGGTRLLSFVGGDESGQFGNVVNTLVSNAESGAYLQLYALSSTYDNFSVETNFKSGVVLTTGNGVTGGLLIETSDPSAPIALATNNIERLRITSGASGGNVGIGTTNPTSKLSVVGNVKVSGVVTATSFVGDGSGLTNLPGPQTGIGTFDAIVGVSTVIDSFDIATENISIIEYNIFVNNGENRIQSQKALIMLGDEAYSQEYVIMYSTNHLVSVGATISGGICNVTMTPSSGVSGLTTFKFSKGGSV